MKIIHIRESASAFAEDKDVAQRIRIKELRPNLKKGHVVEIDFTGVEGATQSFVHAMISDLIRSEGQGVLDLIRFRGCNKAVRYVIEIVVEYSQLGIEEENGAE